MKPKPPKLTLIILLLLCMASANAQNRLSSVKVFVSPSSAERLEVISLLQLDHFIEENGAIHAEIGEEDLIKLKASRFKHQVLIEDVGAYLERRNKPYFEGRKNGTINIDGTPTKKGAANGRVAFEQPGGLLDNIIFTPSAFQVHATLGGYYSYAQMATAVANLFNTYSPLGLVDTFHIGTTVEGRIIYAVKISDNVTTDDTNEPEVFFQGVQHAREAIGGSSMIFLMQYLCQAYTTGDTRIINLVNNREIFIVPFMNPDGWEYNRSTNPNGGGGWRKNRKIIRTTPSPTQYGVDLNRNWNVDWAQCSGAIGGTSCGSGSNTTSNDTYWGTAPFSEPETQAVRNFIRKHHIVVANDQHSVGPYYSLPYGRPALHNAPDTLLLADQQWYTHIPALMGKYNGMRAGNSVQALGYEVAGGVKDWFFEGDIGTGLGSGVKTKIYGMTGEGGYRDLSSTFWPPAAEIVTLCKGMAYQDIQMIYSAGSYVDIQDMSDIAVTATSGTFDFKIKRIGLQNQPVTVTAIALANIGYIGAPVTVNSLPNYYDTYTGSVNYHLPANISNGQRIRFVWKVETGGQVFYDTIVKFFNPVQLLYDNMEGANVSTNWSVSSGWTYVADSGYNGTKALHESPNTAYPANSTRTAQYTGTLNLSNAGSAYITFWVKHRAENFHDKLQVQVSPNGSTWTNVRGKTTVEEPGTLEGSTINGQPALTGIKDDWEKEVYNISQFAGSSALRLRFVFTSDGASSFWAAQDAGFFIDELKVIKSTLPVSTLPVNFTSFTATLTRDNTVLLEWKADVDAKHSHFIVERSTDGQNYSSIGKVEGLPPYSLVDPHPAIGTNYYRIKQVDIDGQFTYSKVNTVYFNPARLSLTIYPNPAEEYITLRFKAEQTENIAIQVSDLSGKIVYTRQAVINGNNQELKIAVKEWPAQAYIVKAIRNDNSYLVVQKFIKQ